MTLLLLCLRFLHGYWKKQWRDIKYRTLSSTCKRYQTRTKYRVHVCMYVCICIYVCTSL